MKQWQKPTISIVEFVNADVIRTSMQETGVDVSGWWNVFSTGGGEE